MNARPHSYTSTKRTSREMSHLKSSFAGVGRRRSLSARIIIFLAVIVSVALTVMIAASGMALRTWMTAQLDETLNDSLRRRVEPLMGGENGVDMPLMSQEGKDSPESAGEKAPSAQSGAHVPRNLGGPGSKYDLMLTVHADGTVTAGAVKDFAVEPLSAQAIETLTAVKADEKARTVRVDSLGKYRVLARKDPSGSTTLIGQSLEQTDRISTTLMVVESIIAVVVTAGASLVGWRWVKREMTPLGSVAATARLIGGKNLRVDDVEPFKRVDAALEDVGTEVGDVAQALNQMIDNVEGALQARAESEQKLRQFVADASHELRTPLASIQGYAQLLQRDSIESELALSRILSESHRMSGLVEDLLLLARLDAGRTLDEQRVDVLPLVIDAVSDGHAASPDHLWDFTVGDGNERGESDAQTDTDIPGSAEEFTVLGDEAAVRQILANLVTNARVHTPEGTTVRVGVQWLPPTEEDIVTDSSGMPTWRLGAGPLGTVRLTVSDDGPGIPEHLRSTVFDRFVRGDSSRTRSGAGSSGLGLSIVSSLAEAMGGRVDMQSTSDGTAFHVSLPRHRTQ